jgi:YegS/Rv2252/BmrU family lipid kinase
LTADASGVVNKIGFVINPKAGVSKDILLQIRSYARRLEKHGIETAFAMTEARGHATEIAAAMSKQGCDVVAAVGGDGTANETAQGLLGSSSALAIIPYGSGNGLARGLNVPLKKSLAVTGLRSIVRRSIDVGTIRNGSSNRFFFGFAGIGFDAHIGRLFNLRHGRRGLWPYIYLSITGYWSFQAVRLTIDYDGGSVEATPFVLAVANTNEYGNGAVIAPTALPDDGLFAVSLLRQPSFLRGMLQGWRLFNGTIDRLPEMTTLASKWVRVRSDTRFDFHADGEVESCDGELEFNFHHQKLYVAIPVSNKTHDS